MVVETANTIVFVVTESLLALKIVAALAGAWSYTDAPPISSRKLDRE